jgi:hypothetical protein
MQDRSLDIFPGFPNTRSLRERKTLRTHVFLYGPGPLFRVPVRIRSCFLIFFFQFQVLFQFRNLVSYQILFKLIFYLIFSFEFCSIFDFFF